MQCEVDGANAARDFIKRNAVGDELPRLGLKEAVRDILRGLCRAKPETTYDNFVGGYGERFVDCYSLAGRQPIDVIEDRALP